MKARCLAALSSGMPVVSISSPPESHGVGSSSSEMWTQRTGASAALGARRELEVEFVEQALDGQHAAAYPRTRFQASPSTACRTSWISSNCSLSAISGGASWTTGSPRSSARQIRPRS